MSNTTTIKLSDYKTLGQKLAEKQKYVLERYNYYNDEQIYNSYINRKKTYTVSSDAIKLTIDDLRNKLLVSHFINADKIEQYFTKDFLNKVIKSCLISGCAFARVFKDSKGNIKLIPYDAYYATGTLTNENTLSEAITIENTDDKGNPNDIKEYSIKTDKVMPIVPIVINQNALRPFGGSFITKKMMRDTDSLKRNKQRAEAVADTLAQATSFLLGVSEDLESTDDPETLDKLKDIILITKDADNQNPQLATTENGGGQLEQKIKDLEYSIKYDATSPGYIDMVESIRQDLVDSFNLIGDTILKVINDDPNAKLNGRLDVVFKTNDFTNLSQLMDGILKVNQGSPNYFGKEQLDKKLGMKGNESNLINAIKTNNLSDEDLAKLSGGE